MGGIKTINCAINTRDLQKENKRQRESNNNNSLTFISNIRNKRRITIKITASSQRKTLMINDYFENNDNTHKILLVTNGDTTDGPWVDIQPQDEGK